MKKQTKINKIDEDDWDKFYKEWKENYKKYKNNISNIKLAETFDNMEERYFNNRERRQLKSYSVNDKVKIVNNGNKDMLNIFFILYLMPIIISIIGYISQGLIGLISGFGLGMFFGTFISFVYVLNLINRIKCP